mmetsp:Transcript_23682/g.51517  ORF Transcript_23682/g.51517 Transcript_23682/m.51517 type:complete len:238 (+) Transcript_23682:263-976(+)
MTMMMMMMTTITTTIMRRILSMDHHHHRHRNSSPEELLAILMHRRLPGQDQWIVVDQRAVMAMSLRLAPFTKRRLQRGWYRVVGVVAIATHGLVGVRLLSTISFRVEVDLLVPVRLVVTTVRRTQGETATVEFWLMQPPLLHRLEKQQQHLRHPHLFLLLLHSQMLALLVGPTGMIGMHPTFSVLQLTTIPGRNKWLITYAKRSASSPFETTRRKLSTVPCQVTMPLLLCVREVARV